MPIPGRIYRRSIPSSTTASAAAKKMPVEYITVSPTPAPPPPAIVGPIKPPADRKNVNDPKYIGPGTWYTIHSTAKRAGDSGDYNTKKEFVNLMEHLKTSFVCTTCRKHIGEYMDAHPFNTYWIMIDPKTKKDIGLFKWSFDFHNAVNQRLGYPIMDWDTAYNIYYDESSVCDLNCGH